MKSRSKKLLLCLPATVLLILAVILFVLFIIFDQLFLALLAKNLALSPSSPIYPSWLKPKVPIDFSVRLFNITNSDQVLLGARPVLREVGPFVYRETRERYDVKFNYSSSPPTVRYKHRIFYHFDRERSIGDPNDFLIVAPDLFYLGALAKGAVSIASGHGPFLALSAQQLMWGYYPPALNMLIMFGMAPDRKVGLFGSHNGTNVNEFVINTGGENIQDIGKIYEVDGMTKMDVWDYPEANMINGTDGSLAPPGLNIGSTISFHVPDICRSTTLYAVGKKSTITRKDIEVIVFTGNPPNASDPLAQWRTRMFCKNDVGCPPKGLLSLEPCLVTKGAKLPFFLSQPLFLGADPSIGQKFDGLSPPSAEKHSTWVHIEPTTGFVLEAFKKIQFNVFMDNVNADFKNMTGPYYFPIGWLAETAIADEPALAMLSDKVFAPRKKMPILLAVVSAVVFLSSIILFVILLVCSRRRSSHRGGKRKNVVAPTPLITSSTTTKDDARDSKPSQWSADGKPQRSEAKPLLSMSIDTDPSAQRT